MARGSRGAVHVSIIRHHLFYERSWKVSILAIINLDVDLFKSEYVRLRSNYGLSDTAVNVTIVDEIDIWDYMLLRPHRRLRFGVKLANLAKSSPRPTEDLAIARAFGFPVLDEDFATEKQYPRDTQLWYCAVGEHKRPIDQFATKEVIAAFNAGKKLASAVGYCCAECKVERAKLYWKRAA